ncbi:MAG: hypothetical protein JXB23_17345 [Candidatus Aminicenantes bacterium]|nr:hypothetical protein [Candidatus Aminicenantes bacterium]
MRKTAAIGSFIVFVFAVVSGFVYCRTADISGTWLGETEIPDQGTDELTLVLEKSEDGYTGILSDSFGMLMETECEDVEFKEDLLKFNFSIYDGYATMAVSITLKVEGNTMTGHWETDDGSSGEITLEKQTG